MTLAVKIKKLHLNLKIFRCQQFYRRHLKFVQALCTLTAQVVSVMLATARRRKFPACTISKLYLSVLITLSSSATDSSTSCSVGRLTMIKYNTSCLSIFLMIPPFRCCLGKSRRLGPRGALPRDIRLSSRYSRLKALRLFRLSRPDPTLIAPPVTRETREPLLAGWLGSLKREEKPGLDDDGTASDEPS